MMSHFLSYSSMLLKYLHLCVSYYFVLSIELALIYFRHYTRMISSVLAMVYLQI